MGPCKLGKLVRHGDCSVSLSGKMVLPLCLLLWWNGSLLRGKLFRKPILSQPHVANSWSSTKLGKGAPNVRILDSGGFLFSLSPDPIPNSLMRPGDLFLNPASVSSCPLPLPRGAMGSRGSQPQHCQGREGGIPVYYRMFSNILGLYPLDASSPLLLALVVKTVCRHGCLSPEGQNYPPGDFENYRSRQASSN